MKNYDNILNHLYNTPWLITQEGLDTILSIVDRKMAGEEISLEQLAELREQSEEKNRLNIPDEPGVAVLPIHGSIFPKANLLTEFSGGTSIDKFMSDLDMLMNADSVKGILLDIDSPGGSALMMQEGADAIWEARQSGKKPIWAVSNAVAASGAYYLGSQAEKLFVTPSGVVGSVGVISVHTDETQKDANEGIKRTVLTVGENKGIGHPAIPLDDKAVRIQLETMTEIYDDFVNSIARGRGVSADDVRENYGKGRVYKSRSALEKGMVDGIKTIGAVSSTFMDEVFTPTAPRLSITNTKQGAKMAEVTPETLEALGLSEDATSEDVSNAVAEILAGPTLTLESTVDPDFATQYPEQAKLIQELQSGRRQDAARMFARGYERFSTDDGETGEGFTALAMDQVEVMHLHIADGLMTHDDLKTFLDNIASGNAVVQYGEIGSARGKEPEVVSDVNEAATQLRDQAMLLQTEEGLSYGDALSKVMSLDENAELVAVYRNSTQNKPTHNGGGE